MDSADGMIFEALSRCPECPGKMKSSCRDHTGVKEEDFLGKTTSEPDNPEDIQNRGPLERPVVIII